MYGFRYHLVTIISIFMALGIGILLGGAAGQELFTKEQIDLLAKMEEKYNLTRSENAKWSRKVNDMSRQTSQYDEIVRNFGRASTEGKLIGKKVVILQLEKGDLASLSQFLQQAGAEIQSYTRLKDPDSLMDSSSIPVLANRYGILSSSDSSLVVHSAKELAVALSGGVDTQWVTFMKDQGWIEMRGLLGTRPDAVVVIGGGSSSSQTRIQEFDIPLLKEMHRLKIPVVACERSDAEISGVPLYIRTGVSTVDNIDQFVGRLALLELLLGKKGNYGVKPTAETLVPVLEHLISP